MKQNYFIYNGIKYYTGTEIIILKYPYNNPVFSDLAYFIYYDVINDIYAYRLKLSNRIFIQHGQIFKNEFGGITGKVNSSIVVPQTKQLKDFQIPSLFIGWGWYIFIMSVGLIFNARIIIWIFTSIIFFNWRNKKIEEEGYYVEW